MGEARAENLAASASADSNSPRRLHRGLGLYDSTMIVAGSMIGSGIFIVAGEMAREVGSVGWLMVAWLIAGVLTLAAALSYGELAAMMPSAGGQYVYLREAYSPLWGFLYGWTLFLVIQTGTIAASAVGFSRYLGVLWPLINESHYLVPPIRVLPGYAVSLSTAQLVSLLVIAFLTWANSNGLKYGKGVQNVFTTVKIGTLLGVIFVGLFVGWNAVAVHQNFSQAWQPKGFIPAASGLTPLSALGMLVALSTAQIGSLFAADAWNNITFSAGEVRDPARNVPLSLALGTVTVIGLYMAANLAYTTVLPFTEIQHAPQLRAGNAGIVGGRAGSLAHLPTGHPHLRESLQQPARLCGFRGAALLHSDARGYFSIAPASSACASSLPRFRLSGRAGALHFGGHGDPDHPTDLSSADNTSRYRVGRGGRSRVLPVPRAERVCTFVTRAGGEPQAHG
jgi:amino acid transporter